MSDTTRNSDILGEIESIASEIASTENEMRQALVDLSDRLARMLTGRSLHFSGKNFQLDVWGPPGDETYTYGHIFYGDEGLHVAYRTSDDDFEESINPDPHGPSFKLQHVKDISVEWMRVVLGDRELDKFLEGLRDHVQADKAKKEKLAHAAVSKLNQSRVNTSQTVSGTAARLGFGLVAKQWNEAQTKINSDPADAVTRACSLIETVCKHVLEKLGLPLPGNQDIRSLYRAAAAELGLAAQSAGGIEIRGICQGLSTVTQNIGALRTKIGTAHGRGTKHLDPVASHARLAVDSAGVAATFIMESYERHMESMDDASD